VLIALLGGPRLGYRLLKDRGLDHILERGSAQSVPVLLISTKDGADTFVRETVRDRNAVYRVIGMLSDSIRTCGFATAVVFASTLFPPTFACYTLPKESNAREYCGIARRAARFVATTRQMSR